MKFYLVGGAVRDSHLGVISSDYDFVVVDSSPEHFKDYQQVGKDFPVFLEPTHRWEIALARTERKLGSGHKEFYSSWEGVTLEEDLSRRDLTMNAMAIEVDMEESIKTGVPVTVGGIIDPFNGYKAIKDKILYPCTAAFKEDPLRVLRAARFLARDKDFNYSKELFDYCLDVLPEIEYLSKERIWVETEKALKCRYPRKYFEFLEELCRVHPSSIDLFTQLFNLSHVNMVNDYHQEADAFVHTMMVLEHAQGHFCDPEINWSVIQHDLGKYPCMVDLGNLHGHEEVGVPMVEAMCKEYKVPNSYRDLAVIVTRYHLVVHNCLGRGKNGAPRPKTIMKLFEGTSALTKPERFIKMLKACEADHHGRIGIAAKDYYYQREFLTLCLNSVINVDTKSISSRMVSEGKRGDLIGEAIRVARIDAIRKVQKYFKENL
jgi:tRNA nucleotidyltransferase (CCA-adding enzyme)